jgi:hypothetical protein
MRHPAIAPGSRVCFLFGLHVHSNGILKLVNPYDGTCNDGSIDRSIDSRNDRWNEHNACNDDANKYGNDVVVSELNVALVIMPPVGARRSSPSGGDSVGI